MSNPLIRQLSHSRNPKDRDLARRLARGRTRGLGAELQLAMDLTQRIAARTRKDGGGPGAGGVGAATSADVGNTQTYSSVPQARRRITGSEH